MSTQYWEEEIETMSREKLQELQLQRLKKTISIAANAPYYKEVFSKHGITSDSIQSLDDIRKVPFTTKADMRAHYPFGLVAGDMRNDGVRIHSSSGTTGNPTVIVHSQHDLDSWANLVARCIPDLLSSPKTCPEETIHQLGTLDEHASAEDLLNIVTEFIEEFKAKFGEHVHVLDWALHLDESTPHIHERHVFDCENKYGELAPQQEKALEALGFDLPDPGKPLSRRNNRKIAFDAACRKMLFEIAKRHGLELEEEAEYGNRKYLEKQDFILAKQKELLSAQQNRLDELTLKVSDMETLLEDVSAAAYDKAVEVVTETVRTETRKEDMRMIEDTKKWVLSPERKAPQSTREYTAKHLDSVLDKFLKTMQTTAARLQEKLLKPEVRQKGKEQVKEKARDSVLQLLNRLQAEQAQRNPSALSTAEKSENRFQ